jgi:nucleoside-diphosphate-sugar epimerase
MKAVVTGAAGFIGSHLVEALLEDGWDVTGVDCLTGYYDPARKRDNLQASLSHGNFTFLEADLRRADLGAVLRGAAAVFHQAGQPGVRGSWGDGFGDYVSHNILATQRLLETARQLEVPRVVYASSSSVYGNAVRYPTTEADLPRPHSPYGVTKLAAEHLCRLYAANWGLATVSLRYFTVFGPRQRPDMAMARLVEAAVGGTSFPLFGDGAQVRDFTYVADVVRANLAAARADVVPGTCLNIAGGSSITMRQVIALVEELSGASVELEHRPAQPGDARRTGGNVDRAKEVLGWEPQVPLREGLANQISWCRRLRTEMAGHR